MSTRLFQLMMAAIATVLLAGVVSAATYEDDAITVDGAASAPEASDPTSTTTTVHDDDATEGGDADEATAPPPAEDDSATDPTATSAAAPPPPPTTTPDTTAPPANGAAPNGQVGSTPGTYHYDYRGTIDGEPVSGTSTLTVSEVDAEGRQTHVEEAEDGTTTTSYRHAPEGTYLEALQMQSPQGSFRMEATSPFLLIPVEAQTGTITSGTLRGDGLTAEVTFTFVEVGAEQSQVHLHADISGQVQGINVTGTSDSDILARTADLIPMESRTTSEFNAPPFVSSSSEIHSVLRG